MRVSVIIAAHNEGATLWRTVASCVETCAELDYEIVIADDASSDGSIDQATRRFPQVRVVRNDEREGASPAKALGAEHARGEVLVFLDGHTKSEYGAIARLVEDIGRLKGEAVVVPQIPALDAQRWKNNFAQSGSGYRIDLTTFACGWLPLEKMSAVQIGRKEFYESPALIGCALAVHRELYEKLWGFDRHMRLWGVEDLDFGLKCWLLGSRILHDPQAVIGHRFRATFDNYSAPIQNIAANQLRMARKNFSQSVWEDWLDGARQRQPERLQDHPEGLWAHIWQIFEADRESVERERAYLLANRPRDEFWYADHFGLAWPVLGAAGKPKPSIKIFEGEGSPSPPPPRKCRIYGINPASITVPIMTPQVFTATGYELDDIEWDTGGKGNPEGQTDNPFYTQFDEPGNAVVTAKCPDGPSRATSNVTAVKVEKIQYMGVGGGWLDASDTLYVVLGTTVTFRAVPAPAGADYPEMQPTWTGANAGVGSVVSATFLTQSNGFFDYKAVTAKCGNTVTANVIVCTLTGTLTPDDNFQDRSQEKYGLVELVHLSPTITPPGVTAKQLGGVGWRLTPAKGGGRLIGGESEDGMADYEAARKPVSGVKLLLRVLHGLSKGMGPAYTRDIVAPSGGNVVLVNNGTFHCQGYFSIGIATNFFLTPKDVSFSKLVFLEGKADPKKTDWFSSVYDAGKPRHDQWTENKPISRGNATNGCQVVVPAGDDPMFQVDKASFYRLFKTPTYKGGTISLRIPWRYAADEDKKKFVTFTYVTQACSVDATGKATISKGNSGSLSNMADDLSNNPGGYFDVACPDPPPPEPPP